MKIYRYDLDAPGSQEFEIALPDGFRVVRVGDCANGLSLWAEVDPGRYRAERRVRFRWVATGEDYDEKRWKYVATHQLYGGTLVFHLLKLRARWM